MTVFEVSTGRRTAAWRALSTARNATRTCASPERPHPDGVAPTGQHEREHYRRRERPRRPEIVRLGHTTWMRERYVRIEVQSANQFGQTKIVGEALVALP